MDHSLLIRSKIERRRNKKIFWENEFGSILEKSNVKEYYENMSDYKIYYHNINNISYFKIVPSYFKLSCDLKHCQYYDGYIKKHDVFFEQIPIFIHDVKRRKYSE